MWIIQIIRYRLGARLYISLCILTRQASQHSQKSKVKNTLNNQYSLALIFFSKYSYWEQCNVVILYIICPSSLLPVLHDAVQDDGEADVNDEEGEVKNQGNDDGDNDGGDDGVLNVAIELRIHNDTDDGTNDIETETEYNVAENNVCSKQFVFLEYCSMNFQAGKDETNYF